MSDLRAHCESPKTIDNWRRTAWSVPGKHGGPVLIRSRILTLDIAISRSTDLWCTDVLTVLTDLSLDEKRQKSENAECEDESKEMHIANDGMGTEQM